MQTIWKRGPTRDKTLKTITQSERKQFQDYYNTTFHHARAGSEQRGLSDEIHLLMHELDRIVDRIERGEFTQTEVMRSIGHGIAMDQHLIRLYLDAHWDAHKEGDKALRDRFWSNVPTIVDQAASWKARSEKAT
jgi:hypothetical protein